MPTRFADSLRYLRGLYHFLPAERLNLILQQTGRHCLRRCRLPASAVTWQVIALALFPDLAIPWVWRPLHPSADEPEPVESAFAQARQRLGIPPLRQLFLEVARPMATRQTVVAFYRGWRLMGLGSTVLDLPDTFPSGILTDDKPVSRLRSETPKRVCSEAFGAEVTSPGVTCSGMSARRAQDPSKAGPSLS